MRNEIIKKIGDKKMKEATEEERDEARKEGTSKSPKSSSGARRASGIKKILLEGLLGHSDARRHGHQRYVKGGKGQGQDDPGHLGAIVKASPTRVRRRDGPGHGAVPGGSAARGREPDGHLSERGDVDSEGSKSDSSQSSGIERWEG